MLVVFFFFFSFAFVLRYPDRWQPVWGADRILALSVTSAGKNTTQRF
jgi:hypothetical protein